MENELTLDELQLLAQSSREKEHRHNKFIAALKGIDLDESNDSATAFEEVQRKVEAQLAGKTDEEYFWDMAGIEIEEDED